MKRKYLARYGRIAVLYGLLPLLLSRIAGAQELQFIPFTDARWEFTGESTKVETYLGYNSLYLSLGFAILQDFSFSTGIIEFDVALPDEGGFPGILFRMQDEANYEDVYFRPHQNGNPDAIQYAPTYGNVSSWQLFNGPGHWGQFDFPFGKWIHARLVIATNQGELFLDDMEVPVMFMHDLKRDQTEGTVGFRGGSRVHYANFRYVHIEKPELKGHAPEKATAPESTLSITSWLLSTPFSEGTLKGVMNLTNDRKKMDSWWPIEEDVSGTTNFSRIIDLSEDANSVFAKVILNSEKAQYKNLSLGYSDRVQVFLNGQLLYRGTNRFQSRDYRYLGSIGFFDHIVLPLKQGDNELLLAVSEDFGGWGVRARIEDASGVRVLRNK